VSDDVASTTEQATDPDAALEAGVAAPDATPASDDQSPDPDADLEAGVASAQQEARDAEALLAALEDRVRGGDQTITPAELERHRSLVRFASLRIDAAHRRVDIRRAEGRRKLYASLNAQAFQLAQGDGGIPEAFAEALEALRRLWAVARRRQASVETFLERGLHAQVEASANGEVDRLRFTAERGRHRLVVRDPDGQRRQVVAVKPAVAAAAVLARALVEDQLGAVAATGSGYGTDWPAELKAVIPLARPAFSEWPTLAPPKVPGSPA
jgi:hypothetical protein